MASSSAQTHYELLGITQQAQLKEVKDAYRKLALKCHPDKNPGNPRAVLAFQKLSAAYETLSDANRRTKYDATLPSSQRAWQAPQSANWPPQRSSDPDATTHAWQDDMRRRAWDWSRRAQERADQARREDDDFWSGPTYAHGATDTSGWSKPWDQEEKNKDDLYEHRQRERAARDKTRKEAERKKEDMNKPQPRDPSDHGAEEYKARVDRYMRTQEAREKAKRERREDDGSWGIPPSPQQPEPGFLEKAEKDYQERLKREKKERADRKKDEREQFEKKVPAELLLLLSKIISIELDIEQVEANVDESKRAAKDEREDEDLEQIFDLQIKQRSLGRRLNECLDEYKRIVNMLRGRGRTQDASEAEVKLQETRRRAARNERTGRKGTQEEQAESSMKTKTKVKAEKDQGKSSANKKGSYMEEISAIPHPPRVFDSRGSKRRNAELPPKSTLPTQNDEGMTQRQQASDKSMPEPRVSYDSSDPDRGFTKDTPEFSIVGDDDDYDDEDYDPPFCNDFHDSHMEVHREFWDIIDDWHECNFCRRVSTVMRCPTCDVQACAYCKDRYG